MNNANDNHTLSSYFYYLQCAGHSSTVQDVPNYENRPIDSTTERFMKCLNIFPRGKAPLTDWGGFPLVLYWDWLRDRSIACSKTGSRDNSVMNGVTWLQRGRGSKEKYIVIEKQCVQSTLLYKHNPQKFRSPNSECTRIDVYCL